MVTSVESAERAVAALRQHKVEHLAVSVLSEDLGLAERKKVKQPQVLCIAMYAGPSVDFGSGPNLWIDATCDELALQHFRGVFEDEQIPKVYHNYSQVVWSLKTLYGPDLQHRGLAGDVMHMGRLANTSKKCELTEMSQDLDLMLDDEDSQMALYSHETYFSSMKPQVLHHTEDSDARLAWINYACLSSCTIFRLRDCLENNLSSTTLTLPGVKMSEAGGRTMLDFYTDCWLEFAEVIQRMQDEGIAVDAQYLARKEADATAEREKLAKEFLDWANARSLRIHGQEMQNLHLLKFGSSIMLRVLLFSDTVEELEKHAFVPVKLPAESSVPLEHHQLAEDVVEALNVEMLKEECRKRGLKVAGKKSVLQQRLLHPTEADYKRQKEWEQVEVELRSLELGLQSVANLRDGLPSCAEPCLKQAMENAELDDESRGALEKLLQVKELDHLLSNFLIPLQDHSKRTGRIHSECNLNTETGRLSSVYPNLQNQPSNARYDVRKAFVATQGNKLVVADYGQLELRVVAHLANCGPMIEALNAGGDFHSSTAAKMYSEIQQAIDNGQVALDDRSQEDGNRIPLVKELYSSKRKKAKTLNFSILYGKTAFGLANDWGISLEQAKETIELWFQAFPEVKQWQHQVLTQAKRQHYVNTLLGRRRHLPAIAGNDYGKRGNAARGAVNTPVQGGAADIVSAAMVRIHRSEKLKKLGYKLLLQIHDEVILEGPAEHAEEAKGELVHLMVNPFEGDMPKLRTTLAVDAKICDNWSDGKD